MTETERHEAMGGNGHADGGEGVLPEATEAGAMCRALLDGTRDDVLIADEGGIIRFISGGLAAAAGSDPGELLGQPADRALALMELPSFARLRSMLSTVSSARTEAELVDREGGRRPVLLRGVSTRSKGRDRRYVWFVTPLTRVRAYERANRLLRTELQTQSRVLALVSHELRTPLNVVLAQLSLLESGLRGPLSDEQADSVDRATRASQALLSLINDLIDFARLESGEVTLEFRRIARASLLDSVREAAAPLLEEAGATLTVEDRLPPETTAVGDPNRTRQILLKLISNALKFGADEQRDVRVTLHPLELHPNGDGERPADPEAERFVGIDVCDTGSGIPGPERDRLFEPFQQGADLLTRHAEGSGLGLAIARRLARMQGGDLVVHRASSEGSIFRLYLPSADRG